MKKEPTLEQFVNFLKENDALDEFDTRLKASLEETISEHWEGCQRCGGLKFVILAAFEWPDENLTFWILLEQKYINTFFHEC